MYPLSAITDTFLDTSTTDPLIANAISSVLNGSNSKALYILVSMSLKSLGILDFPLTVFVLNISDGSVTKIARRFLSNVFVPLETLEVTGPGTAKRSEEH